ncbi:MAG: SRPBCC family protein [Gammaproteobacteria bacterium]|nr:SRPBCC family protein [Gammaproteobacteria bacterium]MDH5730568.1 SRPBCC family protein [Gammaproteobacteria bacterium]
MKYSNRVEIHRPLENVVKLWNDENNFFYWQDGFVNIDHIKGMPGEPGSESNIYLKLNNREMVLKETVLSNNLPHEKCVLIEHSHMTNTMTTKFRELGEGVTEYSCLIEYTKFNGIIAKLMALLVPNFFKKQSQKWLDNFKAFAEAS